MSFLRGTRHGVRCLASAAACRPLGDRPPSADRSIEIGSMLLTRLDGLALVAHATRRGDCLLDITGGGPLAGSSQGEAGGAP